MEITFLGATGTVTGSKYLVDSGGFRLMVDCGLFQGYKQLRLRNWAPFPVDPREIDAVLLTHAHIDHSGYLPLLVRNGFEGSVYCTPGTRDLCSILLPDSGNLQEEEAREANSRGSSKHKPALPLYTRRDAAAALRQITAVRFGEELRLGGGLTARFEPAGHILGAACVRLERKSTCVVFSGDLGRPDDPILPPPARVEGADYLVVESTYGNRAHGRSDPGEALAAVINRTAGRGGVALIPAFAVGRAQTLLYYIHAVKESGAVPDVPVYLDSPMAASATRVFASHVGEHRLSREQVRELEAAVRYVGDARESRALSRQAGPKIVISASGMATGGRVLNHLAALAPDPRNTILFTGFQAGGTRGAAIVGGAASVKIYGEQVPIRAEVAVLDNLSAHADAGEILGWLEQFDAPPERTFITHGEPDAADALRRLIGERLGWPCVVPDYRDRVTLA
jgi:metallo-beta-lactamase family protein